MQVPFEETVHALSSRRPGTESVLGHTMFHPSMRDSPALRIAIVGGGIASLVAGITLRDKLPNANITLYTDVAEAMLGGQLASWDEDGYPVEHGLHALFGFYDHILPLLQSIGAGENLRRSKEHLFIREGDALHRFDLRTWPATYRGFSTAQRVRMLAALPAIGKLLLQFKISGSAVFDEYDQFDLRTLARRHGVPDTVLQSGFFRQFYEAAFNAPSELSAAVGLASIYQIFSKPWHYYFELPTRESIIRPLQRHFIDRCRGRIEFNQRLMTVRTDDMGTRVSQLDFENSVTGLASSVEADEYILALGLDGFKQVDFGEIATRHSYFQNVRKLQTVSSFSIQAWFKEDPVPLGIDSMITGMPPPFGILCPITRVRGLPPSHNLPLPYEVIATGPEQGFEEISDVDIMSGFLRGLRDIGFKIPADPLHTHVVLRRNRQSFHRYLLTRPGELHLRPAIQSPLKNLCLAGAWVRNDFALPCVEAAAQGAIKAAGLVATRWQRPVDNIMVRHVHAISREPMPAVSPPYCFPRTRGSFFLLKSPCNRLSGAIPDDLALYPGLRDRMLFAILRHEEVYAKLDPSNARYAYNEVLLAAFVREKRCGSVGRIGIFPIALYVDDPTAMSVGRAVYGFPKKMARIALRPNDMILEQGNLSSEPGPRIGGNPPILNAHWSVDANGKADVKELRTERSTLAPRMLGNLARLLKFYNLRHRSDSTAPEWIDSDSRELTTVSLTNTAVRNVSSLYDLHLKVNAPFDDPISLLAQAPHTAPEIRANRGVQIDLAFSMPSARTVGAVPRLAQPICTEKSLVERW